jgi:hypothetical protein
MAKTEVLTLSIFFTTGTNQSVAVGVNPVIKIIEYGGIVDITHRQ